MALLPVVILLGVGVELAMLDRDGLHISARSSIRIMTTIISH